MKATTTIHPCHVLINLSDVGIELAQCKLPWLLGLMGSQIGQFLADRVNRKVVKKTGTDGRIKVFGSALLNISNGCIPQLNGLTTKALLAILKS